jgi:hypothetical protein
MQADMIRHDCDSRIRLKETVLVAPLQMPPGSFFCSKCIGFAGVHSTVDG